MKIKLNTIFESRSSAASKKALDLYITPKDGIAFGDYSYYNIGDRGNRSFKQLNELFAGNGMIGFVTKERVDGKLVLPEAVQIMKLKAD